MDILKTDIGSIHGLLYSWVSTWGHQDCQKANEDSVDWLVNTAQGS